VGESSARAVLGAVRRRPLKTLNKVVEAAEAAAAAAAAAEPSKLLSGPLLPPGLENEPGCGRSSDGFSSRIIGGQRAAFAELPWQVRD